MRVTFSPLTRAAYLAAGKACVSTKPQVAFPLRKQEGRITIPTAKGPKVFADITIEATIKRGISEAELIIHQYLGYLPEFKCHLVKVEYDETSEYVLIDNSGTQIALAGEPIFAPDTQHIAAICQGIEYGGGHPNSLQVLEMSNGRLRQVWRLEPKTGEPYRICWTSATSLLLSRTMWTGKSPGTTFTYAKLEIQ
ncbi:hypothetical protein GCM10022407_24060 [Hymenobacter antarcticus]|uniref:Uncharacterized protein n=2 Tax=Hymenobacter antarcticus TaxID=486270 RepID=A0ABP7Q7X9_9BACT